MNNQNKFSTAAIAKLAMMTAVSMVLLLLVRIPFPPAPFLVYDPADVPIYITAFAFGPAAGLIVTLVVCLIQAFMLGGDGLYGFLMHFVATGIVAVVIAPHVRSFRLILLIIIFFLFFSRRIIIISFKSLLHVIIQGFYIPGSPAVIKLKRSERISKVFIILVFRGHDPACSEGIVTYFIQF